MIHLKDHLPHLKLKQLLFKIQLSGSTCFKKSVCSCSLSCSALSFDHDDPGNRMIMMTGHFSCFLLYSSKLFLDLIFLLVAYEINH